MSLKSALCKSLLVLCVLLSPIAARAGCASLPNAQPALGTTANPAPIWGNFNSLQTCATTVDNTQIGPLGIYPNQLLPLTTAQGTFGGTNPAVGFAFGPYAVGIVPLTVAAPSGQTADIADVTLNAVKVFFIGSTGSSFFNAPVNFTANGSCAAANVCITNDNGATNGLLFNVPTGSTNGVRFQVNGVTRDQIDGNGAFVLAGNGTVPAAAVAIQNDNGATAGMIFNVPTGSVSAFQFAINGTTRVLLSPNAAVGTVEPCPTINASAVCAPAAPGYTAAGVNLGSTYHVVVQSSVVTLNGTCLNSTICALTSETNTSFTNSAVFASSTSYSCQVGTQGSIPNTVIIIPGQTSGSAMFYNLFNVGGSIAGSPSYTVTYMCTGT